jgi:hypothetical protein
MSMVTCAECSALVSDKASQCVSCGAPIPKPRRIGKAIAIGVFGVLMAVLIGGALVKPSREQLAKDSDRGAIRYCWEQQSRKSVDPATARFMASSCEKLEGDFRAKYGGSP